MDHQNYNKNGIEADEFQKLIIKNLDFHVKLPEIQRFDDTSFECGALVFKFLYDDL